MRIVTQYFRETPAPTLYDTMMFILSDPTVESALTLYRSKTGDEWVAYVNLFATRANIPPFKDGSVIRDSFLSLDSYFSLHGLARKNIIYSSENFSIEESLARNPLKRHRDNFKAISKKTRLSKTSAVDNEELISGDENTKEDTTLDEANKSPAIFEENDGENFEDGIEDDGNVEVYLPLEQTIGKSSTFGCDDDVDWSNWGDSLRNANTNHVCSPAYENVIICGDGITKSSWMSVDLYKRIQSLASAPCHSACSNLKELAMMVLEKKSIEDILSTCQILSKSLKSCLCVDCSFPLTMSILKKIMKRVYIRNDAVKSESFYSFGLVWPVLEKVCDNVSCEFVPGEVALASLDKARRLSKHMAKHPQNADGIIKTSSSIELAHLEVSGHFGLVDNSRSGWDFFKLWRGCKAMLVTIACKYRFASTETFSKLKVFGIHCHKSQIDVWEMRPVAPNIYVFLRSSSFRFEEKFEASMVISCSKLVSMLQNCLKESRTVLENLDKEHQLMLVKQQLGSSTPVARLDNIYTTDMRTLKKAGNKKGVATCAPGTE